MRRWVGARSVAAPPALRVAIALLVWLAAPVGAQTASQTAAWDALMLSPIGAFSSATIAADSTAQRSTLALRFGRWRYNSDDAAHEIYGLTWTRAVGSRSHASITGAYNFISCADCGGWVIAGADFESTLARGMVNSDATRPVWASLGLRGSVGGGHLRGDPGSVSRSVAVEAPADLVVRYRTDRAFSASLTPGLGYGRMTGQGSPAGGLRPMLGLTTAWNLTSPLRIEIGAHRVFIGGGPTELGVSFTWGFR